MQYRTPTVCITIHLHCAVQYTYTVQYSTHTVFSIACLGCHYFVQLTTFLQLASATSLHICTAILNCTSLRNIALLINSLYWTTHHCNVFVTDSQRRRHGDLQFIAQHRTQTQDGHASQLIRPAGGGQRGSWVANTSGGGGARTRLHSKEYFFI